MHPFVFTKPSLQWKKLSNYVRGLLELCRSSKPTFFISISEFNLTLAVGLRINSSLKKDRIYIQLFCRKFIGNIPTEV